MTLDEDGNNSVENSLLFLARLATKEEPAEQGCALKKEQGCFPKGIGNEPCRDIDTCSESTK